MVRNRLVLLFIFLTVSSTSWAQANRDYIIATQLIRLQDYERAKIVLEELIAKEPTNPAYLQQITQCYINLKEYETGVLLLSNPKSKIKGNISLENDLALLYHYSNDTTKAFSLWNSLLANNDQNVMAYQMIANSMLDRREFSKAAKIYQQGRVRFKNSFLFLNELANAYLQANEYNLAAKELITILENNPGRLDQVQRMFSRFNDEFLFDEAILFLDESGLEKASVDENVTQAKRELLLWLYLERGLDKRALRWAEIMEKKYPTDYFVYNVAQNLIRKEAFELADNALNFYLGKDQEIMRPLALDAKSQLYVNWGKQLEEQGLSVLGKADELFEKAAQNWEIVISEFPDYQTQTPVKLKLIDLYLEKLAQNQKARMLFSQLVQSAEKELLPDEIAFYEGRFDMLDGEFRKARIKLTDANRASKNATMLEKSRYYLALNDFYAFDFEFAKIQLKSVERQPTSFYANDALVLRNWIRKGIEQDSVKPELELFSKAAFAYSRNEFDAAFTILSSNFSELNALQDEAALIIVDIYKKREPQKAYEWISSYPQIEQFEQLLFNKLSLAFVLFQKNELSKESLENQLKDFLTRYPNGFYADQIRNLLQITLESSSS
ncbi:hypothetical protein EP331_11315 [bacterium]|nr:MAG: hypothetical protein EP331_11315 [bacterium]